MPSPTPTASQPPGRSASPWAELRIGECSAFRAGTVALPELTASRVRFSLGGSAADARVPWDVTPEAGRIFAFSGLQLLALLVARHRDALTRADHDRLMMDERFASLPDATEHVAWVQTGNPDARAAAAASARAHPLLTAGVMTAWLGPGGAGRSVVALLIELLRTATAEMPRDGREETPTLVAAMAATLLGESVELARQVPLSPPSDRLLLGAVASGIYLAARTAVDRVVREARLPPDVVTRVEAAFNPIVLLGGRLELPASGATLYGCDLSAGLPWFEEALARMAEGATADVIQLRIAEALAADRDLRRRAETSIVHALMRERFLTAAVLVDQGFLPAPSGPPPPGTQLPRLLREYATLPYRLSTLLDDEPERRRLSKEVQEKAGAGGRALSEGLLPLAEALRRYSPKEPLAAFGLTRDHALLAYARAAVAGVCDVWTERALSPAFRALDRRTGLESEGGNDNEYARGRLYRLSVERQPLLKEEVAEHVGHLFADVKDFTRRTALVGQAAMGELLRREFYLPVITSAKAHHTSHGPLASGNLQLNNLLGDAVSLSGSITALLALAQDLRRHLSAYERQLAREVSKESVERTVAELEERFLLWLSQDPSRAEALRLQAEHETALARARGEGLEAGVFLSWGPAPLVLTIADDVFGASRVAIADKINESARGTARTAGARVRADDLLNAERTRRGDGALKHPWAVFVGAPLLPGTAPADDADEPGDIYNTGIALSEDALRGFEQEVGRDRVFRGVDLWPQNLHAELQRRFYFPPSPIRLIVAYTPDGGAVKEIFRYAGRVLFRGFEAQGPIRVWELVSETNAGGLIALHHAREWFRANPR